MANPIKDLIETAINSLDGLFTTENVIGDAVTTADGTIIIPIAKLSFGVGGGGSEFKETASDGSNLFGGGVGAGASVKPEGFLVITTGGSIRFISTTESNTALEKLIDYAPDIVEKITGIFAKKEKNSEGTEE